jgi:hypothetical protein
MCNSQAIYGGGAATAKMKDGRVWQTISRMTHCVDPFPIKRGDNITVEANYDFAKHPSYVPLMGSIMELLTLRQSKTKWGNE